MPLIDLSHFGFLMIQGRDAEAFLQGYTTCDLTRLDRTPALLGAICNIQGKVLTTLIVARIPVQAHAKNNQPAAQSAPARSDQAALLLRMERNSVKAVQSFLSKYIVFSKAEMTDLSDKWYCYGTYTEAVITDTVGINIPAMSPRREIWSPQKLSATGSVARWRAEDIKTGIVWINPETSDQYLPHSLNLHNLQGIDFDKGCYLGQEIIARVHYLGATKKNLFAGVSGQPQLLHTNLTLQNKAIGSIIATAQSRKEHFFLAILNSAAEHIEVSASNTLLNFSRIS